MKKKILRFRTIILSDVHLGTPDCKVREVLHFLKHTTSQKLILNGDIIDGWQLKRGAKWTRLHTKFIRTVLKKSEKGRTEVVYLRGNHDDILGRFLPITLGSISIVEDHIHSGLTGKYFVLHGDIFDSVTKNFVALAHLGDVGYKFLMGVNRFYNKYRSWRGKEYYSLSKAVKAKVKSAVSFISRFEEQISALAKTKHCAGVICGHIHTPEIRMIDGIHYLNSGDWVESLTAIVEHFDGRFELIQFQDFCEQFPFEPADVDVDKPTEPATTAV